MPESPAVQAASDTRWRVDGFQERIAVPLSFRESTGCWYYNLTPFRGSLYS